MAQVVERAMCEISATIRDKSEWWLKLEDDIICARWKQEILDQVQDLPCDTNAVADFVLAELHGYVVLRDDKTGIEVRNKSSCRRLKSLLTLRPCSIRCHARTASGSQTLSSLQTSVVRYRRVLAFSRMYPTTRKTGIHGVVEWFSTSFIRRSTRSSTGKLLFGSEHQRVTHSSVTI